MIDTMNSRYWEIAPPSKAPIAFYLCYSARTAVFQREQVKHYLPTLERLPFTNSALRNRFERGADVPPGYQAAVYEITQETEDETARKIA